MYLSKNLQPGKHQLRLAFIEGKRLAIMWSPKAACSTVIKWVLHQNGVLDQALSYGRWIHKYRRDIYQKSAGYLRECKEFQAGDYYLVKVVRDPYARAVSSFLAAYRFKYADERISQFLGDEFDVERRFSFRQFVGFLKSEDLHSCNPHYRLQATSRELAPINRLKPDRVIQIESGLEKNLAEIESEFGLARTNFHDPNFTSPHHTHYTAMSGPLCDAVGFDPKYAPRPPAFYDRSLAEAVHFLYRQDFKCYNYDDSIDRLLGVQGSNNLGS